MLTALPRTALLVIDLIEDYFDASIWPDSRIPGNRENLVERTNDLVSICRKHRMPIAWVRQEFEPGMSNAFIHARKSGRSYAIRGTRGSRLLAGLDIQPSDQVIIKLRFSAFFETSLSGLLTKWGVERVILAGITTAWCIRSTATDAYQRDLRVILASECLDAFTERDHEESLRAMDGYIAEALTNDQIWEKV